MSRQDNAETARKLYDAWNDRDFDRAVGFSTEDIEVTRMASGETFQGPDGFRLFMSTFATAFPEMKKEITNQVAEDDQVVFEFRLRGTHTGPLKTPAGEIAPTGRSVDLTFVEVLGFRDGKVAFLRNYSDGAALMRQLGLME